jgi:hypothetical protein
VLDEVGTGASDGETAVGFDELVREVADRIDTDPSLIRERVRTASDPEPPPLAANGGSAGGPLAGA